MTEFIKNRYNPYDFCFDAPGMLAFESEEYPVMSKAQYDYLWDSPFEDLCFQFEEDWDSFPDKRKKLTEKFISDVREIYDKMMAM